MLNTTVEYLKIGFLTISVLSLAAMSGCTTVKPYEKEYLLNPLMDDAVISSLSSEMLPSVCASFEKLASAAPGAGGSSSCPTCGG
jgi:hypothetical protein